MNNYEIIRNIKFIEKGINIEFNCIYLMKNKNTKIYKIP